MIKNILLYYYILYLLYIFDTNFLFFFVFQVIQASLLNDFGQEGSQDQTKQKKIAKIVGPFSELEQVPVIWEKCIYNQNYR